MPLQLTTLARLALRLSIGVGLMEAAALEVMSAPFRRELSIPLRLAFDGIAGAAGAIALLFALRWILRPALVLRRLRFIPLILAGAVFLAGIFALEIGVEQVFFALDWGPVTNFWNGVIADGGVVLILFFAFAHLYNKLSALRIDFEASLPPASRARAYRLERVSPSFAFYLAGYESLFVAAQLGGIPVVLRWAMIHGLANHLELVQFCGWLVSGMLSSLLMLAAFKIIEVGARKQQSLFLISAA